MSRVDEIKRTAFREVLARIDSKTHDTKAYIHLKEDDYTWLISRIERLEEALMFYADGEHLPGSTETPSGPGWYEGDDGKKARAALEDSK